mmetsp:Transcript_65766/g.157163  ORF Transcript_65766/g.157163 Transcript_65766/m.157163 type:complete len:228 (-) Transcript_65766:38-721(-)
MTGHAACIRLRFCQPVTDNDIVSIVYILDRHLVRDALWFLKAFHVQNDRLINPVGSLLNSSADQWGPRREFGSCRDIFLWRYCSFCARLAGWRFQICLCLLLLVAAFASAAKLLQTDLFGSRRTCLPHSPLHRSRGRCLQGCRDCHRIWLETPCRWRRQQESRRRGYLPSPCCRLRLPPTHKHFLKYSSNGQHFMRAQERVHRPTALLPRHSQERQHVPQGSRCSLV